MPKVFEWRGYKFFFFSNEGQPREPCHIHVRKGEAEAKFWASPYVSLASSYGMSAQDLLSQNIDLIRRRWDAHFGN